MRRRDFFRTSHCYRSSWRDLGRPWLSSQCCRHGVSGEQHSAMWAPWTAAFVDRLKALGWDRRSNGEIGVSMDGGEDPNSSLHLLKSLRGLIQT